jgi:hypothetical protein
MARTLIASDNFNRAGPALGANWGQVGPAAGSGENIQITASTKIYGAGASCAARWVGAGTFTNDQYSSLVILAFSVDFNDIGVIARASADQDANRDHYIFRVRGITNAMVLSKCVNGTVTNLATGTGTFTSGDRIEIECEGTAIRGLKNGSVLLSATDAALTTGAPGVYATATGGPAEPFGDDWEGGAITAGGAVPIPRFLNLFRRRRMV